jgi:hypothetical protein
MENTINFLYLFKLLGNFFLHIWWIILPVAFYNLFELLWIDFVAGYSAHSFAAGKKFTLLEIIPPREIERGPKIMESFFVGLSGTLAGVDNYSKYLKGAVFTDPFSLELVSDGGKIHFYIRTETNHRNLVEAQIYAQYSGAEVVEVEDYCGRFPRIIPNKNWNMWGTDFEFVRPNAYSIKTYDRFEESITGEMIDPMAALLEIFGTLPPGQNAWLQFVIQPLSERWSAGEAQQAVLNKITGRGSEPPKDIFGHLMDVFSNILNGLFGTVEFKSAEKKEQMPLEARLTPAEKDTLKAVEEKLGKNCFNTKMRLILLGRKENFSRSKVGAIIGAIKQFNDINMNQVKPEDTSKTYANVFRVGPRADFRKRKLYTRYCSRSTDGALMVFSTKELATMFHLPDMNVKSPAIPRVSSKLGSAPINLPID